jgi:hypothetical protein
MIELAGRLRLLLKADQICRIKLSGDKCFHSHYLVEVQIFALVDDTHSADAQS